MEVNFNRGAVANTYEEVDTVRIQPSRTEDVYQTLHYPSRHMKTSTNSDTGLRRKCLLGLSFTGAVLLAITLTAVTMHYTYNRGKQNLHKGQAMPKVKNGRQEPWLPFEEDFYLFWQSDGANCDTAKHFCAQRNANLTLIDQNNVDWIRSMSKGMRLWILQEQEGSGTEDSLTPEDGDAMCGLLHADSNSHVGDGWVCMRRS